MGIGQNIIGNEKDKSMKAIRIIPRLDIKGPNLVKGIHLEGLRVLGKPSQFASYYYQSLFLITIINRNYTIP